MASDSIVAKGSTVPFIDEHTDGWQAFCAGKDKRSNPFKHKKGSDQYTAWVAFFERAKRAGELGHLDSPDTDFGTPRETAAAAYFRRHEGELDAGQRKAD